MKKIEKLPSGDGFNPSEFEQYDLVLKLNEVIDVLNKRKTGSVKTFGYKDGYNDAMLRAWTEVEKAAIGPFHEKYLKKVFENYMKTDNKIYTSEGDAVGEVDKRS